jgi:hypothetical protein
MGVTLLPRSVFVRRRDTVRMRAVDALLALIRSVADPTSAGLATPADHPRGT